MTLLPDLVAERDGDMMLVGGIEMFEEPVGFRPQPPAAQIVDFVRPNGDAMKIRLVGGHPLWGHVLYPAAIAMSKYLEEHANSLLRPNLIDDSSCGKYVLELGAGAGLPGLTSVLEGAELVVSTDFPDAELIDNLKQNANLNLPAHLRERLVVEGFTWGTNPACLLDHLPITANDEKCGSLSQSPDSVPAGPVSSRFDLILMSDLVFNHSQQEPLLRTCESCLRQSANPSSPSPSLLVFFSHHRPRFVKEDNRFIELAKARGWRCKKVVENPDAGLAFPEDDGDQTIRGTVHGWILTR
ncbi:hypothetical protein CROQUDRAFT_80557 [Cronartium quercuum f. sp. fusiforme G11]|uniref:Uncharacterized protein n=1 Tax=Cronartium quercuum f. sp. fusiforme G11 TaxID=708437 RepID=A0A9P6NGX6_9BASI|nr:hypothetical protein CROQUDRAFT_80557 [Cronartium quercuum f. sp. fusiforme G11]